jgi:peptidoglycan hydrolase-like protein with peptidoglycan-binding domain
VYTLSVRVRELSVDYIGMQGEDVHTFQAAFNAWDDFGQFKKRVLQTDQVLGLETLAAIEEWQRGHSLTVDQVCGPQTWATVLPGAN